MILKLMYRKMVFKTILQNGGYNYTVLDIYN